MRSGRLSIHLGGSYGPIRSAHSHHLIDLLLGANVGLSDITHIDALALFLVDLKVVLGSIQEVPDFLHVDFDHGNLHIEYYFLAGSLDPRENSPDHARNDALQLQILDVRALHRVGLPRGSLPVGEDGPIEPLEYT